MLSRIDPVTQAERLAASAPRTARTLYLAPRPLFGYGLAAFAATLDADSAIAAVEPDAALYEWTLRSIDAALGGPRFTLVGAESAERACAAVLSRFPRGRFRRVTPLYTSAAWQEDAPFFNRLLSLLDTALICQWGNAMTLARLGRLYARNFFRNLPLLASAPRLGALDFGRDTVLVAGAGPSLNRSIGALLDAGLLRRGPAERPSAPAVEEAAGGAEAASSAPPETALDWLARGGADGGAPPRVVAVDTALQALLAHGVVPDLVVALEAQHWNLDDFAGLAGRDIALAMDCSALPRTARVFKHPPYLFWTEWTPLRVFGRLGTCGLLPAALPPLGSVGLYACAVARRLTRGAVIRAGLDFAFSGSLYHCRASPSHKKLLRETCRLKSPYPLASAYRAGSFAVAPADGAADGARSDPALERYRALFEQGLPPAARRPDAPPPDAAAALAGFAAGERARLVELRDILRSGGAAARLESLLDDCDYLWAHFPECAARGGARPPAPGAAFLKRVRVEIDPFLKLLEKR